MALFVRRKEKVPNANVDLPSLLLLLLLSFPPSQPRTQASLGFTKTGHNLVEL